MDKRVGVFTPERAKQISDFVRAMQASGTNAPTPTRQKQSAPPPVYVYVYNSSGFNIPLGGCFQIQQTVTVNSKEYPAAKINTVDSYGTYGAYFFAEYGIPVAKFGIASLAPIVRGICATTTPGFAKAKVGTFELEPADEGPFRILGPDDLDPTLVQVAVHNLPSVTQTVVTDIRIDGLNLQYKTRDILVWPTADETDWVTFHTGEDCTA